MACPRCDSAIAERSGPCPVCGTASGQGGVATVAIPVDTTGLPPGATFGASPGPGDPAATMDDSLAMTRLADPQHSAGAGPLEVGQRLGARYHVLKVLGVGGMGAVYQAWDAELSVAVALKVIRSRPGTVSSEIEKQFKNELLLARQVTHKNVVRIHDLGDIDGIKYITMPYIQGSDLATVLRRDGRLPIERALRLARQVAAGLEAAHEAGVVHRDLKPANVMIGADDLALIMDFGISASRGETSSGAIIGTLEYMAPEQGSGGDVDGRADIYAFGLILYEMLAGPRASRATTAQERIDAMKQRTRDGLPALRAVNGAIPAPLEAVVMRCLERDPAARFATAPDLVAALDALDEAGELIPIPARISRRVLAPVAVLVVALLGAMFVVGRLAAPPPPKAHDPVSVVIADIANATGDPAFDRTLEPALKLALEGAGFISAYDRSGIRRSLGVKPPDRLDERGAIELAVKQGLSVVVSGTLDRRDNAYDLSLTASEAVTGKVITTARETAAGREEILGVAAELAAAVRKALGDETSESAQRFATQTFSAMSLEVIREYAAAAEALSRSRSDEALRSFSKAVALDPNFGLAYAGMAIASRNMDRQQDAEKYIKEAVRHLDGMTERERYRTRGLFYFITGDYQACVKEYGDLIVRYAADAPARNNLALCLTYLRQLPRAVGEMQQVVRILPKRALYRENLALYAAYQGDAQTAEQEVRRMEEPGLFGLLALAFTHVLQHQPAEAAETYQRLAAIDRLGGSYTASGLGDLALYDGRFSDAVRILSQGAAADLAMNEPDRAANKFAALASAHLLRQQQGGAVAAADRALGTSKSVKIRFLAARVFVEAGATAKARTLAAGLGAEFLAEPQAYAKIIEAGIALRDGHARQAVTDLVAAGTLLDTWIGHFDLARAYLAAGAYTQADSELDRCLARRGEALALFLDEEPTYGIFPAVYYYQGRVREALNNAGFADSYRAYLDIRGQSTEDPLLPDVRRRAGS